MAGIMSFDIGDYVDVKTRLKQALDKFPDLRISESAPLLVTVGDRGFIQTMVTVWRDAGDLMPCTAYNWEPFPGRTPYTKDSEQQNSATSALGRALGYMGFGIETSIASANEVRARRDSTDTLDRQEEERPSRVAQLDAKRKPLGSAAGSNTGMSTAGQKGLLVKMCEERGLDFDPNAEMTFTEASEMITALKATPKK
jgi:hypothetical protein